MSSSGSRIRERLTLLLTGAALGVLLVACSGFQFKYRHYDLDAEHDVALGPTQADDRKLLELCASQATIAHPCYLVLRDVWDRLERDYTKLETDLDACQKATGFTVKLN